MNRKRKDREFARCYGSKERVAWVKAQCCVVSGEFWPWSVIENVHVKGDGAGRKADARYIVPMSAELHRELHRLGIESFQQAYRVDLAFAAEATEAAWQRFQAATQSGDSLTVARAFPECVK